MYYKEEIINGVLCYKTSPRGQWHQFSQQELTKRIEKLKQELAMRTAKYKPVNLDSINPISN